MLEAVENVRVDNDIIEEPTRRVPATLTTLHRSKRVAERPNMIVDR